MTDARDVNREAEALRRLRQNMPFTPEQALALENFINAKIKFDKVWDAAVKDGGK